MTSLLLALLIPAHAGTVSSFWNNRAGVRHLNEKAYYPAYQDFMRALADDPLNFGVQMNLGLTFLRNEEFEKAEQAFRGAARLAGDDAEARFTAEFNLALALSQQGKTDQALAAYQECLELQPDSLEVKTNIELLWQGGGGGKGKSNDTKDSKDDKSSNQEMREKGDIQNQPQKKEPKPFDSRDLTKEDVKRILDEIKNQEQGIRAQEYDKGAKEAPRGKDW